MKKIDSTRKISMGSIIRVYKQGFGYTRLTVIDNNDNFFGLTAENDFFNFITDGDKIQAYLWVEDVASYNFDLEAIGRIDSREKVLFFRHTDHIIRSNDRMCLTADVDLPIKFFVFETRGKGKSFTSEKVDFHYGTIVKLADRSAVIKCTDELSHELFYKGHVLINNEDLELVGKVKPVIENNEKLYEISYVGMSDKERNRLLDYIFGIYRE